MAQCNCGAGGHSAQAITKATRDGYKAQRKATSSPYLFCAQLSAAFDQGYAQAKALDRLAALRSVRSVTRPSRKRRDDMFETCKIVMLDYVPTAQRKRIGRNSSTGHYYWTPDAPHKGKRHPGRAFYMGQNGQMDERGSTLRLRIEVASKWTWTVQETDTVYIPIIARLPSGRGFLSGWTMGEGMLSSLDGHIWTDEDDARSDAENEAERAADSEAESLITDGLTAPSAWASYLINGDASGIDDADVKACDAWIASVGKGSPHSCYDAGFIRYHDASEFMPLAADCQSYHFD